MTSLETRGASGCKARDALLAANAADASISVAVSSVVDPASTDNKAAVKDGTPSGLSFSDVLDVIETDLSLKNRSGAMPQRSDYSVVTTLTPLAPDRSEPYVVITEQPASKSMRFRYECEGRSAGSLPGVFSSPERKTYPSIRVMGYQGAAVVVVSCVTKDAPHRPHPHNLIGKEGCKKGVCTLTVDQKTMSLSFSNLGIQCVKKKDVEESLKLRENIRVDPFQTGFEHGKFHSSIDLNVIRLCFQVFIEGSESGRFVVPLKPVVSQPIYDKKSMNDLTIYKMSDCSSPVCGGKEIILLCDKVSKDDIEVRFFEVSANDQLEWEGFGDFSLGDVHKQVAISFRTPPYRTTMLDGPANVYVQLRRPSDGQSSENRAFVYTPAPSGLTESFEEKKRKTSRSSPRVQPSLANEAVVSYRDVAGLAPVVESSASRSQSRSPNRTPCYEVKLEPETRYIVAEGCNTLSPNDSATMPAAVAATWSGNGNSCDTGSLTAPNIVFSRPSIVRHTDAAASLAAIVDADSTVDHSGAAVAVTASGLSDGAARPGEVSVVALTPAAALAKNQQLMAAAAAAPGSSSQLIELDLTRLNSDDLRMLSFSSTADGFSLQSVDSHLSLSLSHSLTFLDDQQTAGSRATGGATSEGGGAGVPAGQQRPCQPLDSHDVRMDSGGQLDSGTLRTINQLRQLNQLSNNNNSSSNNNNIATNSNH